MFFLVQYEFSSEKLFFHQKSSAFSVKNCAAHAALALNCTGTGLGTGNATATISDPAGYWHYRRDTHTVFGELVGRNVSEDLVVDV